MTKKIREMGGFGVANVILTCDGHCVVDSHIVYGEDVGDRAVVIEVDCLIVVEFVDSAVSR